MRLDPKLVHPTLSSVELAAHANVDAFDLPEPQRLAAKALVALLGSDRMPDEMAGYARRLNEILDAVARSEGEERSRLLEHLEDASQCAGIVESATSGMACDNGLMGLDSALDGALRSPRPESAPRQEERTWVSHEPFVLHASLLRAASDLSPAQRYAAEALVALRDCRRTPDELAGYARRINAILDACDEAPKRERLTEHLRRVRMYVLHFRAAQSGMAGQNALEGLEHELDEAYRLARDEGL